MLEGLFVSWNDALLRIWNPGFVDHLFGWFRAPETPSPTRKQPFKMEPQPTRASLNGLTLHDRHSGEYQKGFDSKY